jgi:hypothetical protein
MRHSLRHNEPKLAMHALAESQLILQGSLLDLKEGQWNELAGGTRENSMDRDDEAECEQLHGLGAVPSRCWYINNPGCEDCFVE